MRLCLISHICFDKALNLFPVNCMATGVLIRHAWFGRIGEIYSRLFVISQEPTKIQL